MRIQEILERIVLAVLLSASTGNVDGDCLCTNRAPLC